jgi:hypothetical protein
VILTWPSTSRSEDAAVWALVDLATAARDQEYRVIGGNMTTFHGARHTPRLPVRTTSDADAGIESSATAAESLVTALIGLGYRQVDGSRFTRDHRGLELIIDLLVPDTYAQEHNIVLGPLSADAAPGLALALAREATWVDASVVLTTQEEVSLRLPLPDSAAAVVLKTLAWSQRLADKDATDVYRLLDTWEQDVSSGQARKLRRSTSANRAVGALRRSFLAPKGKAKLLPTASQTLGRRLAAQFKEWVEG